MKDLDELGEKYKFSQGVLSCLKKAYGEELEKVLDGLGTMWYEAEKKLIRQL